MTEIELIKTNPSFTGDIRLYSHSGLCNRLRLIVAYKHLSDITGKTIEMFWTKSTQCHCLFEDLFEPINNVNFTYLKQAVKRSNRPPNTAQKIDLFPHDELIKLKNHLIFRPIESIMDNIQRAKSHINSPYISCHIRRTDIGTIQKKYNVEAPSDDVFIDFMEQYPEHKIFLATDDGQTQSKFKNLFKSRIHTFSHIRKRGHKRRPVRTTSIQDAVSDIFLCIDSEHFLGTPCSSFSSFIENYRKGRSE